VTAYGALEGLAPVTAYGALEGLAPVTAQGALEGLAPVTARWLVAIPLMTGSRSPLVQAPLPQNDPRQRKPEPGSGQVFGFWAGLCPGGARPDDARPGKSRWRC
jgi:hypothetical protein